MPPYLVWKKTTTTDFSDSNINSLYGQGYLFTRVGKGVMNQTRSVRVDLDKFTLTSENRRILKKTDDLQLTTYNLPLTNYHWSIGKMAKDFYDTKFGAGIFSVNKIKELLTTRHNFNLILKFSSTKILDIGYCICYTNKEVLHYSYPFYKTSNIQYSNIGISMMLKAIIYAKEADKKYIYLGSAKDEKAKYKLQFEGLEWWDEKKWNGDMEELKRVLSG